MLDVLVEFGLSPLDFGMNLPANFVGFARFERFEMVDPGGRFGHFLVALGDFLVDPLRQRLVVHDHVDDRKHRRQIAAPQEGDHD